MLEINLLPGGVRKKAAAGSSVNVGAMLAGVSAKFGDKLLIACVAIMVVAVGAGGYLYYRQTHDRSVAEARLEKATSDSVLYAKVVAARIVAEAKRDTLLRQVNLIRAIDEDRFIWPHIMDEVSRALPAYTWVLNLSPGGVQGSTNVVASPPPPKRNPADTTKVRMKVPLVETAIKRDEIMVRLTGRTVDIQAMTRFMQDLENSPFFANIYNEGATPLTDPSGDFYQFQLIFSYSRPDSNVVRRLPLVATRR